VGDISFFKMLYMVLYFFFLGYQENKFFLKSMKTCQFLCHAMNLNNGNLDFSLGGPLFQKHPNPQMLPYTKKTWQHSHDWNWKLKTCLFRSFLHYGEGL